MVDQGQQGLEGREHMTTSTLLDQVGWEPSRYIPEDDRWWTTALAVLFPTAVCSWLWFINPLRPVGYEIVPVNVQLTLPTGAIVRFPRCDVDTVQRIAGCSGEGARYSCAVSTERTPQADSYPGAGGVYVDESVLVCPLHGRRYVLRTAYGVTGESETHYRWWDYLRGWLGGPTPDPPEERAPLGISSTLPVIYVNPKRTK